VPASHKALVLMVVVEVDPARVDDFVHIGMARVPMIEGCGGDEQ
jgi:hypothetical protein